MKMILFFIIVWILFQQNQYPLNKKHEPSTKGIELYVEQNTDKLISEFQKIVGDTLYDVYIYTDDLGDSMELGCFYIPNEIVITNQEKFVAYEYTRSFKQDYTRANNFVKAAVFHELMHCYFNQVINEMRMDSMHVSIEYNNFSMIPTYSFGARFIEEGICEYFIVKNNESIFPEKFFEPKTSSQITTTKFRNRLLYEYSVEYVRAFVDYFGYKKAIQMLVNTKPPTNEEILYPVKFFSNFGQN